MPPLPISLVQYQAAGAKLEAIEGVLTQIYTDVKSGTNDHGPWSFQKGKIKGPDGHEIGIKFHNMDFVEQNAKGHPVRFIASTDGKAKSITVEEYQGKKTVTVNGTAEWQWNPPDYGTNLPNGMSAGNQSPRQGPPQQQHHQQQQPPTQYRQTAQGPPPQQQQRPPQQQPPQQQQRAQGPPPAQQQRPHQPMPIQGATVGMAVKLAGDIILGEASRMDGMNFENYFSTPQFSLDLYTLASDIIRVSEFIGAGNLAESAKARARKAPKPDPKPQPPAEERRIEPDYSHQPPPNEAERAAAERRAAGAAPREEQYTDSASGRYGGAPPSAFPSGDIGGVDDDEIPF